MELQEDAVVKRLGACPFCGGFEYEVKVRVGWLYSAKQKKVMRDISDDIQVFCYECREEIRPEDVGVPDEDV
jgi:hypothetical protein